MATAFDTDCASWITICAAHLQAVGARSGRADAEQTAADLCEDPDYRPLPPAAAAAAFHQHQHRQALA